MLPSQNPGSAPWAARPGNAMAALNIARPLDRPNPQGDAVNIAGDGVSSVINIASGVSILAIPRPPLRMRRTLLIIQNRIVGTELFVAFGRPASNDGTCVGIAAGDNLLLDQLQSIPQNDIYLFSIVAGGVPYVIVNAALE